MKKLEKIQKQTADEVLAKLREYHKCLMVRPTGFGKTRTAMTRIIKPYKDVIFLYPSNAVAEEAKKYKVKSCNTYFYSLCKLRNLAKKCKLEETFERFNNNDSLFIMDEAHSIAAPHTSVCIEEIMNEICPNANFLGMTATPNRTDKLDIKWHYFDGHTVFEYTVSDAITDGILNKPYYVYTPLDNTNAEKELYSYIDSLPVSDYKKDQLRSIVHDKIKPEIMDINNLDAVIANNVHVFQNDMNYYKFICFFTTYQSMHNKHLEVLSAFEKIFPECDINIIIVSSENQRCKLNLKEIKNLKRRRNTVDLIFNVNMLTFGTHIPDLTGILMFRQTISNIIYSQQVGRCLSVVQETNAIIFDFVENLLISVPNSIVMVEGKPTSGRLNKLDILFDKKDITLDTRTKELLEIERLINNAITEEFEEEVVKAYNDGYVSIEYCISKLQLQNEEDFNKVLERYEKYV